MIKDSACFYCFAQTSQKLLEKHHLSDAQKDAFTASFIALCASPRIYSSPEFSCLMHRKLKELAGMDDFYVHEKKQSNIAAKDLLRQLAPLVERAQDKFDMALRLAIAGNVIDFGCAHEFNLESTVNHVLSAELAIDHSSGLRRDIQQAGQILWLGDNAGEIVFDKHFIETLAHPALYYAVRGYPVINDVTLADAQESGLDKIVKGVIDNGYDAPSTLLEHCSPSFLMRWNAADLVIAKGQGNFEGLMHEKSKPIYFLLMVKCGVIAQRLGVKKGDFVVVKNTTF